MTQIWNFRLSENLKVKMKKAVSEGMAKNLSDLVRRALEKYLENPS